jgi:hypothetical protein
VYFEGGRNDEKVGYSKNSLKSSRPDSTKLTNVNQVDKGFVLYSKKRKKDRCIIFIHLFYYSSTK